VKNQEQIHLVKSVWEKALGVQGIPDNANFFTIGGHSLLGVDVCHELKRITGVNLGLKDLLQRPVLQDFSKLISIDSTQSFKDHELRKNNLIEKSALGTHQKQAWYLEEVNPGTNMHNLPYGMRIRAEIDATKLHEAFIQVFENHPALRMTIEKGPLQVLQSLDVVRKNFYIQYMEPKSFEAAMRDMELVAREPLDVSKAPIVSVKLYRLNANDHILLLVFHHAFFDGYSFEVFVDSLSRAYEGKELTPEKFSFVDFCIWQNEYLGSEQFQKDKEFWRKKLEGGLPVLEVPTDYPRPPAIQYNGGVERLVVEKDLLEKLRGKSKLWGVSLFTLFLGSYKKMLMDYSQQDEVVVGVPVMGRPDKDLFSTIGCFANALPVKGQKKNSVKEFFVELQRNFAEILDNQEIPHSEMLGLGKVARDSSRSPLYQTHFSFQDFQTEFCPFGDSNYEILYVDRGSIYTDFDCYVIPGNDGVQFIIEYRKDLFDPESARLMAEYYRDVLSFVASGSSGTWSDMRSISHERVLSNINNEYVLDTPRESLVDKLVQRSQEFPDKTAIYFDGNSISYETLFTKAKGFAANYSEAGIQSGDFVGICMKRTPEMVAAMLGAAMIGIAYVPLDPYFPEDRLNYMVSQTKCHSVICDTFSKKKLSGLTCRKINLEDIDLNKSLIRPLECDSDDVMYVIFTSGSTGRPKGVQATFKNVLNFLNSMKKAPGINAESTVLAHTTTCFDISILEIFLPLLAGASIALASKEDSLDGRLLKKIVEKFEVDFIQATPATWRLLLEAGLEPSKKLTALCGAEPFPVSLAKVLVPSCRSVWNMYGPTETTVWCSAHQVESPKVPFYLGRPIENTTFYVLDEHLNPVPIGAIGELYIGGVGVSKGFCNNKELTNSLFVDDPFVGEGKMYRSGDLVRFNRKGLLEYIGRKDTQVKIRGHRVELGEIEAVLQTPSGVQQVVVLLREDSPGDQRLVAYIKGYDVDEKKLREHAKKKLPMYMVPSHFINLEEFPLTPTLKIDKKKLPAPKKKRTVPKNVVNKMVANAVSVDAPGIRNIRPYGDGRPVILFPEFDGEFPHAGLSTTLRGRPVYGLLGRSISKARIHSISSLDIALGYVHNLKQANIMAPYTFAGATEGALLASKVAEILRLFDEEVEIITIDGNRETRKEKASFNLLLEHKFLEARLALLKRLNIKVEGEVGRRYLSTLNRLAFIHEAQGRSHAHQ
tara:strand:+ start:11517 stop:15164 length:3648 start_codon:yes stop_codon:yes gene_type:complete